MSSELVVITARWINNITAPPSKLSTISALVYQNYVVDRLCRVEDSGHVVETPRIQRSMWTQGTCVPWKPTEISMVRVNHSCKLLTSLTDLWYISGNDLYRTPFGTTTTGGAPDAKFTEQYPSSAELIRSDSGTSNYNIAKLWSWGNTLVREHSQNNKPEYFYFNNSSALAAENTESSETAHICGTWHSTNMCPVYTPLLYIGNAGYSFYTISKENTKRYLEIVDRDSRYEVSLDPLDNFIPYRGFATENCVTFFSREECITGANHVKWDIRQSRPILLSMNTEKTQMDIAEVFTIGWNIEEVPFFCNKNGITMYYDIRADAWQRGHIMTFPSGSVIESVCAINQTYTGETFTHGAQ